MKIKCGNAVGCCCLVDNLTSLDDSGLSKNVNKMYKTNINLENELHI